MEIHFIKTHEDAQLPRKNFQDPLTGDAGFDLFSIEEVTIPAGSSSIVKVGIDIAHITPGFWIKVEGRSGLAFKKEVDPHFGIIDNGYRGEFDVKLFNSSKQDCTLPKGYAVAQMIVQRMVDCKVKWTETATETERGPKGIGSSDIKVEEVTEEDWAKLASETEQEKPVNTLKKVEEKVSKETSPARTEVQSKPKKE